MTKRDMITWLDDQKYKIIREKEDEVRGRKDAHLEATLRSLGFYEMAGEIESHLKQAWDLWSRWKAAHESDSLSTSIHNYRGFECGIRPLVHLDEPLASYMSKYDTRLNTEAMDELNKEERTTSDKIGRTYNSVIRAVSAAKNIKEAKAYLEGLGFDLSELENPPAPTVKAAEIDAGYLFLKKAD